MLTRTIGLSATLALAANAVLLPPTIAVSEGSVASLDKAIHQTEIVAVECPGCVFAAGVESSHGEDSIVWKNGVKNSLVYEFSTGELNDRVELSGFQLFPPALQESKPLYIHQISTDEVVEEDVADFLVARPEAPRLRISQMVFAFDSSQTISEEGDELMIMQLTVSGVEGRSISPQLIRLFVLKDNEGKLFISGVQSKTDPTEIKADEKKQCESWPLLCKWRGVLEDKLNGLKSSMHKSGKPAKGCNRPHKPRPGADRLPYHMRPGHGRPRPHAGGPHHGHHGHHRHQDSILLRFMEITSRVIRVVVVPILVGVAAGAITYMAGLLIGMIVAVIWIKLRGSRGEYNRVALDEEEAEDDAPPYSPADKDFYAEETSEAEVETPPVYQEKEASN